MSTVAGKTSSGKPRNPYIAGKALGSAQGFFGRRDVFEVVESTLAGDQTNAIVLFGQRRIGKTSLLLQLARRLRPPDYLPIYLDLMDRANRRMGEVLHALASAIAAELGQPAPEAGRFDDEGVYFQREVLPQLYQGVGEHQRPVFLLDEFDVLDTAEEQRLGSNAAANSFFPYIRRLIEQEQRLGFVFVVGRKAADLSIHAKAVFKAARYKRVSILDRESAIDLVKTAEAQGALAFQEAAVDRVLDLTSGHPYFTQLLCGLLWDRAWRDHAGPPPPQITPEDVDAAVPALLEAGENVFEWIWDGLPAAERVIFAAIAQSVDQHGAIGDEELAEMLQGEGIRILTRELEVAPATLVDWEMLAEREGGYGFFIEVLRRWVVLRKPLPRVKEELDRVVPLADSLYQTGSAYHRQGDGSLALDQLRQALRVNPNHLKARLLVADISIGTGDLATARKELEEAYRYDSDAARFPLIRVLLLQGETLEREKKEGEAIPLYEQVLTLSPRERVARERLDAIWRQHGDAALEAGDFDAAIQAYERAQLTEQLAEARKRKRRAEWEKWVAEARTLSRRENWAGARAAYERLLEMQPGDGNLVRALETVEEEIHLGQVYEAAVGFVKQKNWDQAIPALGEVISKRPTYKGAARYLAEAVEARRSGKKAGPSAAKPPASSPARQDNLQVLVRESKEEIAEPGVASTIPFKTKAASAMCLLCIVLAVYLYLDGQSSSLFLSLATIGAISAAGIAALSLARSVQAKPALKAEVIFKDKAFFDDVFFLDPGDQLACLKESALHVFDRGSRSRYEFHLIDSGQRISLSKMAVAEYREIFVLGSNRKVYRLTADGAIRWTSPQLPLDAIEHMAVSRNGQLAVSTRSGHILILDADASSWRALPQPRISPDSRVQTIALSNDGSIVVTSLDGPAGKRAKDSVRVVLQSSADGQTIGELPLEFPAYQIAFTPDGLFWTVATIRPNGQFFAVPQTTARGALFKSVKTHSCRGQRTVAFSQDGRFLAAGDISEGLRVGDVATGKSVKELVSKGHILSVDFNRDGTLVVANIYKFGVAVFKLQDTAGGNREP